MDGDESLTLPGLSPTLMRALAGAGPGAPHDAAVVALVRALVEALLAVQVGPADDGAACWCGLRDLGDPDDHWAGCRQARAALGDAAKEGRGAGIEVAALMAALEKSIETMVEWYVQDQGGVLGEAAARVAAEREVAAIRQARAALQAAAD